MLSLWGLVQAARAQCMASAILFGTAVSGGEQVGEPTEVVSEEPRLLSRRDTREAGWRVATEASGVLEGEGVG